MSSPAQSHFIRRFQQNCSLTSSQPHPKINNFTHSMAMTTHTVIHKLHFHIHLIIPELFLCIMRPCLLVGCLRSQQQASVSQGWICSDNFTCCLTEIEAADQTFYLTQSQYTDTRPTSPSADPIMPGTWQGSHWSANF